MSRILLVRLDGIGDALAFVPTLATLLDAGHEVGALLTTRNAQAYANAALERVYVVQRIPWPAHGYLAAGFAQALAEVRAARYDVALVASEEPEAYRFASEAGIAQRTGFINGFAKPLKSLAVRRRLQRAVVRSVSLAERRHEVEILWPLADGLHAETTPTRDLARLRPLVLEREPHPHGRVVVQISPKFVASGLDIAAFASIARGVAMSYPVVLVAGPADTAFAAAVAQSAGLSLEQPPLPEWKHTIAGARALVTLDSGAAHVAGMVGTPCVDLFAAGPDFAHNVARWRPWAASSEAIALAPPLVQTIARDAGSALERLLVSVAPA